MRSKQLRLILTAALLVLPSLAAQPVDTTGMKAVQPIDSTARRIGFSGVGTLECGQIIQGRYRTEPLMYRIWLGRSVVDLTVFKTVANHFRGSATLEGELWYDTYARENNKDPITQLRPNTKINIREAQGCYSFFGLDKPYLELSAGVFPFKYNPDARNLGEYLFRTGTYPGYIITNFDDPEAIVTGLHLGSTLAKSLRQDLIFSTERQIQPYHDFSLSYILGYSPLPALSLGVGVSFNRLISVNTAYTDPKKPGNQYVSGAGDTLYYTFRGTKLMGRLTFDPKSLLGSFKRIFGQEDLRLYGEAAVLGVKNYSNTDTMVNPDYYGDLKKRIPIMMGFNVPAFRLLDVLSLEAEWYGWEYPDIYYRLNQQDGSIMPVPTTVPASLKHDYVLDNWKWSVYARKTFMKSFCITAQAARDHLRHRIVSELYDDEDELLRTPGDWYWMLKTSVLF